jgi:hypothetical protein
MRNKFIFSLFAMLVLTIQVSSQLTGSMVGIPDQVYTDLQNVVFDQQFQSKRIELTKLETKRTVSGVTSTTKEVVLREVRNTTDRTVQAGVYGANLAANFILEYGHKTIVDTDSGYQFIDSRGDVFNIWFKSGKWYSQVVNGAQGIMLTDPYTKVRRLYTYPELSAMKYFIRGQRNPINLTEAQLRKYNVEYRIGAERNPETHVTSLFATVTQVNGNTYRGHIWINGKPVSEVNTALLTTSFGTRGIPIGAVRWKFLNECVPGDGGQMSSTNVMGSLYYEYGNFGTCDGKSSGLNEPAMTVTVQSGDTFDYDATSDVVTYDTDRKFVLWFNYETQGANGKNEGADGYYYVTQNRPAYSLFGL